MNGNEHILNNEKRIAKMIMKYCQSWYASNSRETEHDEITIMKQLRSLKSKIEKAIKAFRN